MPYKDPEKRRACQQKAYRKWYEKNGRNRSASYMECILEWQQEHPDRVRVKGQLQYAVEVGKIKKPRTCENCGRETRLSGHHEDYSKPLIVTWLCSSCHKLKHLITY